MLRIGSVTFKAWLGCLLLLAGIVGITSSTAWSQEEATEAPVEAPAAEAPAAETPPPADAPAAASPGATEGEEEVVQQKSFLRFVFDASRFLFILISLMSIYLGAVIVDGFLTLRLPKVIPPETVTKLDSLLNEKKYKEAYDYLHSENSLFAKAVSSGVERLAHGLDRATDAMLATIEDGKITYEHKVTPVATFGQLGPMIGLFGTVIGMILAFMTISSGEQVKTAKLAGEIAIALCATMEGLVLALPAIYFHAIFKNKIQRIIFEVEWLGERYLWKFAAGLKK